MHTLPRTTYHDTHSAIHNGTMINTLHHTRGPCYILCQAQRDHAASSATHKRIMLRPLSRTSGPR